MLDAFAAAREAGHARAADPGAAPSPPGGARSPTLIARGAGFAFATRSAGEPPGQAPVYLADTMGEMELWYRLAGITFVGGSLVPAGGHTPVRAGALWLGHPARAGGGEFRRRLCRARPRRRGAAGARRASLAAALAELADPVAPRPDGAIAPARCWPMPRRAAARRRCRRAGRGAGAGGAWRLTAGAAAGEDGAKEDRDDPLFHPRGTGEPPPRWSGRQMAPTPQYAWPRAGGRDRLHGLGEAREPRADRRLQGARRDHLHRLAEAHASRTAPASSPRPAATTARARPGRRGRRGCGP